MALTRHSPTHRVPLLLAPLLTAVGAVDIAAAVPARAAALSTTPDCESSGGGHFTCFSGVSGGTAPYTFSWQPVTNAAITSSTTGSLIRGACTVNRFSNVKLTVTDATGATASGFGPFTCTAIAP